MSTNDSTIFSHSPKFNATPYFCRIPVVFPHNFKVMPEVNQYFNVILLESHVEGTFPFTLPQSPHAAVASCFLFAPCQHTDALFSPLLFYSQGCRPIRGQIYFQPAHAWTCLQGRGNPPAMSEGMGIMSGMPVRGNVSGMRWETGVVCSQKAVAAVWRQDDQSPSPCLHILLFIFKISTHFIYRIREGLFTPSPTFALPPPLLALPPPLLAPLPHF